MIAGVDVATQIVGLTGVDVTTGDAVRGVDSDIPNVGMVGLVDGVDTPIEAIAAMT